MIFNTLKSRFIPNQPSNVVEANIRYLYIEIFFAAILGAITTFNNLFAVRLGATTALIGILTSAPAFVQAILSIPSARYLEGKRNRKAWLLRSLLFMRLGHLVIVLLPIIAPNNTAVWMTLWIIVLVLPNAFFANGFNAMLAELIPERRRAFVFSRRTIIYSLATIVITGTVGIYLDHTASAFPANYQVMYLFGVIMVMGSSYYLSKLVVAESKVLTRSTHAPGVQNAPMTPSMKRMLLNVFVYQCGIQLPGPLFIIHYVNELHASDGMISFNSAAGTLGVVFGLVMWEALIRKRGFFWAMRTASCFTWIFPFAVALTMDFNLVIISNFIVNCLHPGMDLSSVNVIFKLCAPEARNMNMSYYTTVLSLSAFAAPLLAVPLSSAVGIPGVMMMSAVLRLVGGGLFQLNRVQDPAPEPQLQGA